MTSDLFFREHEGRFIVVLCTVLQNVSFMEIVQLIVSIATYNNRFLAKEI